jgi:hypothetical protein
LAAVPIIPPVAEWSAADRTISDAPLVASGRRLAVRASRRLALFFTLLSVAVCALVSISPYLIVAGGLQRVESVPQDESDSVEVQRTHRALQLAVPLRTGRDQIPRPPTAGKE